MNGILSIYRSVLLKREKKEATAIAEGAEEHRHFLIIEDGQWSLSCRGDLRKRDASPTEDE